MGDQAISQAIVVEQDSLNPGTSIDKLALFNEDGSPFTGGGDGGGGDGSGWPSSNATGTGNVVVTTPEDDTVGFQFTDNGDGGITLSTNGSGDIFLGNGGTGRIAINDFNGIGIVISEESAGAGILIRTTDSSGPTTGILITTQASDTGGISLSDSGSGGIGLQSAGTGAVEISINPGGGELLINNDGSNGTVINDNGGGIQINQFGDDANIIIATGNGTATTGIRITTQVTDVGGISITDNGSAGIGIQTTGSAGISLADSGTGGVFLQTSGGGGITLNQEATGPINIETTGGEASAGINLTTQASDVGGIVLTDNGSEGIVLSAFGTGPISMTGVAGPVSMTGVAGSEIKITSTGDIEITNDATNSFVVNLTGSGLGHGTNDIAMETAGNAIFVGGVGTFLGGGGESIMGFFGQPGTSQPTISGSRGDNDALASLLTALSGLGLLVDSTS